VEDIQVQSKEIKMVDVDKLIPNPKNNNSHPPEQIARLEKIIKRTGFRVPIEVSNRSGFVVCGHARIEVAKNLGMKSVPVIYQDFESEAIEYAHLTAENEIARWSKLDMDAVYTELESLELDDIELLGLEEFELPDIDVLDPQTDEDDVPEVETPITVRGDIWLLGKHRLMCGDSTMIDDVEKLMDGEKADMVFTDPPYGVSYQSHRRTKSEKFEVLKNDDEFLDIVPIIDAYSRGFVFIWSTWKVIGEWLEQTKALGKPSNTVVWFKGGGGVGDLKKTFSTDWELALVWHRGQELTGKRIGSVWSIGKDKAIEYKHPTQKPVELAEEALDKCSKSGYKVLDLFGGSGSTMIACEKMDRLSLNMELDEKYCDVIVNRWQNYTGKKATLESTNQTYEELTKERL
jgi:DNA modification methylase